MTLYESLLVFIQSVRDNFDEYEKLAIYLVTCVNDIASYGGEKKRRTLRKKFVDEFNSEDAAGTTTVTTEGQQYIVETLHVIIDSLQVALQKRKDAYMMLDSHFGVLTQFNRMTDAEKRDCLKTLISIYPNDVKSSIIDEFIQFRHFAEMEESDQSVLQMHKLLKHRNL